MKGNVEDKVQFWEDIYLADDTGWDLNGSTPVFQSLAKSLKRGKLCIIGCGRGYDAVLFAKNGFEVTAIDFAPSAINALQDLAKKENARIDILQKDIFLMLPEFHETFDYVIEQTCFCAIHPSRRREYEKLVWNILKANGELVGLWFPLDKNINEGGPPYGTTVNEIKSIFNDGWIIKKEDFPIHSIKPRKNREKLIIFKKSYQNNVS